jgi:glycosyltransferase involved in cell wall biosynthesis
MSCPKLSELPPPAGRTGWPWTEASEPLPPSMPDGRPWPCVTVITPSFNQAGFIEATLRSVLLQGYPNLEYLVLDGGSTDGSVEIIERYSPWIDFWTSEPDGGQSAAINRGLRMGTGEFAAWINSDDMLYRNALTEHAVRASFEDGVVYVGVCALMDAQGAIRSMRRSSIGSL